MARIQLRRDTAANWSSENPVLSAGEPGWDRTNGVLKVGDGTTAWNGLPAIEGGAGASTLADLTDVNLTGLDVGDGLVWNGTAWTPATLTGGSVPAGGTTGQALVKASATDYDTAWGTVSGGGGLSSIGALSALVGWWDPDDSTTRTVDGSSRVETLNDKSGSGAHAAQATAGSRPRLATLNGRTWLDFSLGNDFLTTVGPAAWRGVRSYFAVVYLPYATHTGKPRRAILEAYPDYFQGGLDIEAATAGSVLGMYANDGSARSAADNVAFPLGQVVVVGAEMVGGGGGRLFRNNSPRDMFTLLGRNLTGYTGFRFGTYRTADLRFFDGYIGEIVMVDGQLDAQHLREVHDLLMAKWA
jgi:hypothetical protein